MPYQLAALIAASLWATSSIIATDVVRRIGGPRFTRVRMVVVCVLLGTIVTIRGGWETLAVDDLWLVGLSGLVGLTIGDIALFTAMSRIGPRRTSVLFTANAPMAAIGGVWLFGETFDLVSGTGAVLTVVGILLAVVYGNRAGASDTFEMIEGSLPIGAFWGLMGAVGQAAGALAAKPVLDDGADTLAVAATRAIIATVAMWIVAYPRTLGRPCGHRTLLVLPPGDLGLHAHFRPRHANRCPRTRLVAAACAREWCQVPLLGVRHGGQTRNRPLARSRVTSVTFFWWPRVGMFTLHANPRLPAKCGTR